LNSCSIRIQPIDLFGRFLWLDYLSKHNQTCMPIHQHLLLGVEFHTVQYVYRGQEKCHSFVQCSSSHPLPRENNDNRQSKSSSRHPNCSSLRWRGYSFHWEIQLCRENKIHKQFGMDWRDLWGCSFVFWDFQEALNCKMELIMQQKS